MDETHTIAAALPTADDDEQTQFHGRAPRPTAVTALEDLMPRELFIVRVVGDGYLLPTMLASVATVNRSFKDALYQPKVIMFRAATALTEVSASLSHRGARAPGIRSHASCDAPPIPPSTRSHLEHRRHVGARLWD